MHIPENYLSPATCGVMGAAMVPVWAHAVKKVNEELPKDKIPLLGVGAAFSFLGMMFNVPLVGAVIWSKCGMYCSVYSTVIAGNHLWGWWNPGIWCELL